jgi:flagellar motor switch protein FliN
MRFTYIYYCGRVLLPRGIDTDFYSDPNHKAFGMAATNQPNTINMLLDVSIPIAVQLGQTKMTVRELLKMKKGQVVKLNSMAGETVDVFISKKMLAKGEITVVGDKMAVRVSQLFSVKEKFKQL